MKRGPKDEWPIERVEQLRALWDEGLSAAKIAAKMTGLTRSAVIGKAHRLGLPPRPSPIRRRVANTNFRARPAPVKKPVVATVPDKTPEIRPTAKPPSFPKPVVEDIGRFTLTEVSVANTCRWPFGERNFKFCGADRDIHIDPLEPYCARHKHRSVRIAARSGD